MNCIDCDYFHRINDPRGVCELDDHPTIDTDGCENGEPEEDEECLR